MIQRKDGGFSLPGLKRHTGKLALEQNCIKVISDKSNSMAMFLRIRSDIFFTFE